MIERTVILEKKVFAAGYMLQMRDCDSAGASTQSGSLNRQFHFRQKHEQEYESDSGRGD